MSKAVEIVLENCEVYKFKAEDVTVLLDGLGRHFYGGADVLNYVSHCLIEIDKDAEPINDLEDWQEKDWRKRIHKDITQVWIDGVGYHVAWGEGEYENEHEIDIDDGTRMVYVISRTRKTLDEF